MKIGEKNVGTIDRAIRIILGIVLLYVVAIKMVAAPWSYLVALVGIVLLATGLFGTCLIYSALGMSTLQKKS